MPGGLRGAIEVRAALGLVLEVALLLEAAQQRAHRGFLQVVLARDDPVHVLDGAAAAAPDGLHDFAFELGERRTNARLLLATLCHGTLCTISRSVSTRAAIIA